MFECHVALGVAFVLRLRGRELVMGHSVSFWRGRLSLLKSNSLLVL
jgi:hypothetical protein